MNAALDAARAALRDEDAWVVGGAVRDRMLGRETTDVDIVVAGDPRPAAKRIAVQSGGPAFELSHEFGAWRVTGRDRGWQVDVTPLRGDSIDADLGRRDFTINAMAEPLHGGPLLDPFDGATDVERRSLRMIRPAAFDDDPLRVLRLARFACELGLQPDAPTVAEAKKRSALIEKVAAERIFAELRRVVAADAAIAGLALVDELGLLESLLPELGALHGVEQNRYHHLDVHDHTIEVLDKVMALQADAAPVVGDALGAQVVELLGAPFSDEISRGTALRFGALLHDIAKPQTQAHDDDGSVLGFPGHAEEGAAVGRAVLARLKASERLRAHVAALARHHLRAGYLVREAPLDRRAIYRYLVAAGDVAVDVTLLSIADRLATRGRKADEAIARHIEVAVVLLAAAIDFEHSGPPAPVIRGDVLAAAIGIETGPRLGDLLAAIAEAQYTGEVSTADEAIAYAQSIKP